MESNFLLWSFFILGTLIGSFLNVCIVRLPKEKSVVFPGSHCVACLKPILWYDNIPLLSWLWLRGRCRNCQASFSIRYLLVEILTGLVFASFYVYFGLNWILLPYLIMMSGFIVATFVDFEYRIIPDEVSVGGMVVGIVLSLFVPQMHGVYSPFLGVGLSLLGVVVGGGVIYALAIIGDFVFKKETMGGGDIKLMAMIGAFLGWKLALLTFFLAPFFGAVYGIIEKIRTKDSAIAYGPFIIMGAILSIFYGDQIIAFIVSGGFYR